ncbi:MAG: hypothetical protein ACXWDJ_12010, partial [Aeromicrobium sp.]
ITTIAAVFAGVAIPSATFAGSATAAPSHWVTEHGEYGPEISFCGAPFAQQGEVDVRFRTTTHGPDGLPYDYEHADFTDTWTNVTTGELVTVVGSYRNGALRVTDNGDGTLTVLIKGTGNNVFYNEDGQKIGRHTGLTSFELLFDHAGTPTDPSDDEFLAFLGFTKDTGRDDVLCAVLAQTIG